ncbi:hypothetical protein SAMN06264364_12953 [Quadrisphaera granulorum]|uniref:Uncharacterized protein n=1 Tax=Quadrisphaera granulorum TaxID=317664 RepID=A0A315ZTN0_9ACTN|nr:hypothetical protein BXY45_12953 [Quadrisphaera granulorum]SZE98394.1 hypothetical protein SAMN06264364_12953 [Quadrisphaera granulorum]
MRPVAHPSVSVDGAGNETPLFRGRELLRLRYAPAVRRVTSTWFGR